MEGIIRHGRDFFPVVRGKRRTASITLGITTYLLMLMAVVHVTFGILMTSQQYVGNPLKCHASSQSQEEVCLSNNYYMNIGEEKEEIKVFNYFKWTQWIFLSFGIAYLCVSYLWCTWEGGLLDSLTFENSKSLKSFEEVEKIATQVCLYLEKLDKMYPLYFVKYFVSEILNLVLMSVTVGYYHNLLHVKEYGLSMIVKNYLSPNMVDDERTLHNDKLLQLFPREIGCRYIYQSETSQMTTMTFRCKVTNQEYNELFHIVSYVFALLCLVCYILNLLFVVYQFVTFRSRCTEIPESKGLATLSLKLRLLVLLLIDNYDPCTSNWIVKKMADFGLNNHCKRSRLLDYLSNRHTAGHVENVPLDSLNNHV